MNTVNEESKSAAIKTLAIIGFVAALVIALWIAITVIRFVPQAFTSLASLTDSLYGSGAGLTIKAEKDVVNAGEAFNLSWTPVRSEGSYTFSYRCVEGIRAEVRNSDGDIISLPCDEAVTIASGSLSRSEQMTEVIFRSEKQRFTDVAYTFMFTKDREERSAYERNGIVTVVNATIPQTGAVAGIKDTPKDDKPVVRPTPQPKPSPTPTPVPTKPKPAAPLPTYYKTVPVTTTALPVSNPNGQIDLEVTLIGLGVMKNGVFVTQSTLEAGDTAAMRFSVKNIGTKTSGQWTYAANFPADGDDSVTSPKQSPLLPLERATVTLTFTVMEDVGTETARVSVSTSGDVKSGNNTASKSVRIND